MTTPSKIARIAAVLALSIALVPATAPASPLLSGYGGPGQGNQAILGATLLNGPSSGGGGGSNGGGSASSGGSNLAAPTTPARGEGSPAGSRHVGSRKAGKPGARRATGSRSTPTAGQAESGAAAAYNVSAGGGSAHPLLGLAGDDLLYIVLALGVLAFTGALTRRLAGRRPASRSRSSRGAAQPPTSN